MFFFKVKEDKVWVGKCKYYAERIFNEQNPDGSYTRETAFFIKNRFELMDENIELKGLSETMTVKYIGNPGTPKTIRINGTYFPKDTWVNVPLDFDSRDAKGTDQFLSLGFKFWFPDTIKESLEDCRDGDSILVIRKYGGLGDILMQSMIFPELRKRFPNSHISYALPVAFMSLYENCPEIDKLIDVREIQESLYQIILKKDYDFIGDISSSCARYEALSLDHKKFVDKERSDIWAESIGFELEKHKTCIRLYPNEIRKAKSRIKKDERKIIGFAPFAAAIDRSYPYQFIQPLIDCLNREGYRVLLFHSSQLQYANCEQVLENDFRMLGALIKQIDLMISVDTGPLHYAGIFDIPVIGLFGMTDSKVRLSYYRAVAIQGECQKGQLPCWGRESSSCKNILSEGKIGNKYIKIAHDMTTCMFINPERIINKLKEIMDGKNNFHGRYSEAKQQPSKEYRMAL